MHATNTNLHLQHQQQRIIRSSITSSSPSKLKRRFRWSLFHTHACLVVAIVLLVTFELWISLTHQLIPDLMDRRLPDTDIDRTQAATAPDDQVRALKFASPAATASEHLRQKASFQQRRQHGWKPRVVFCDGDADSYLTYTTTSRNESPSALSSLPLSNSNSNNSSKNHVRTVEPLGGPCPYCEHEPDFHVWPFELAYSEQCTPMVPWQTHFYPVCNSMHELDLLLEDSSSSNDNDNNDEHIRMSLLSMKGSWRSVWEVLGGGEPLENRLPLRYRLHHNITANNTKAGSIPQAVLKMLKFESREFDHESFRYHQVDAQAMERLTASPHIVDSYGFCGQSVLTEWAPISARDRVKHKLSSAERLFMGRELAQALADVHSIDYKNGNNATLTHNDINMANAVVSLDGRLKLNDFNIGVLMRWNGSQPCGYPARFHNPLWKSPEEIRNTTYNNPALSDVYSLGNLLFYIMTKHQPWTHLEPNGAVAGEEVGRRKLKGILPTFPDRFVGTNKTATQAMLYAVLSCYRTNPAERLTARELAASMDTALKWIRSGYQAPRRDVMHLFEKKHPRQHKREKHHDRTPSSN
jgi:hypothetical protein